MKVAPPPCALCELPEGIPLLSGAMHVCGTCGTLWFCGWYRADLPKVGNTPPERLKRLNRGRA